MKELFKDKDKEKEKKRRKRNLKGFLVAILIGIAITISLKLYIGDLFETNSWLYCGLIALGVVVIIVILVLTGIIKGKTKEEKEEEEKEKKEKEKRKELVKSLETKNLEEEIKKQREFIDIAEEEYAKRKDRPIPEEIRKTISSLVEGGFFILIIGIILLGAIPSYFGVNDEFTNPTNMSISVNNSLDSVKDVGYDLLLRLHDVGEGSPKIFFWLFWVAVIIGFIYPIIKLVIFVIKRKGGKS